MTRRRLIERGAYHFSLNAALHIRHFFRPLVDQQNDQHHLRMIRRNAVRNRLQQHRLASTWRSHNQSTLPLAHRRQQIHHAARDVLAHRLHLHSLLRIQRRQVVEQNLIPRLFRGLEVDRLNLHQREVLLALMRRPHIAADRVARLQVEFPNLRWRNIDVIRPVGANDVEPGLGDRPAQEARNLDEDIVALVDAPRHVLVGNEADVEGVLVLPAVLLRQAY